MEENIKAKAIVKGAWGVADFVWDHLSDILNGYTVDFALCNPAEVEESIEKFKEGCAAWCGIAKAEVPSIFDCERTVLCACYYNTAGYPMFIPLDMEYGYNDNRNDIAMKVNELSDYEEGGALGENELVYVELVQH